MVGRCAIIIINEITDIRAKSQDITKIGLTYYGVILNNSGDDWNKVRVAFVCSSN